MTTTVPDSADAPDSVTSAEPAPPPESNDSPEIAPGPNSAKSADAPDSARSANGPDSATSAETAPPAETIDSPEPAAGPDSAAGGHGGSTDAPDRATAEPAPGRPRPSVGGLLVRAGAVLAVVGLGLIVARLVTDVVRPHLYSGTVLQAPEAAPPLDGLRLASGEPADLAAFEDEVVLVFFGYTNCPDVCPMTLSTAAWARSGLSPEHQERTRLLMVSVDPGRDDVASVQSYVEAFDDAFLGVGGDPTDIQLAATRYGVYAEPAPDSEHEEYTIDHTASLLGIGPDGRLRIVWPPNVDREQLQRDIEELLS